ncbi:MAG: hypothetical protein B6U76_04080 [Desulfurococcales archaeon ex4484_217_2]|nr:MAG: hypothetical protein B6U76_04080 [Desulfurococcales archaeon ex4484_217_2]
MFRDDIVTAYEMAFEERRRVLEKIREVLESLDFVEFAVVYGGFVKSKYFRDIDVGIFVSKSKPTLSEDMKTYWEALRSTILGNTVSARLGYEPLGKP